MNREIKFRIIYKEKIVGYEHLTETGWKWNWIELNPDKGERWCKGVIEDSTPKVLLREQFTGLYDKEGKEIWEGDVLEKEVTDYEHEDYQAFVDSGYESIEPTKKITDFCTLDKFHFWLNNESFGYEGEDLESPEDWKVIGNVHENKDLLK